MSGIGRWVKPEYILIPTWVLELVGMAWPPAAAYPLGAGLMAAYVLLALPRLRRQTLILCAILALVAVALAAAFDSWNAVLPALHRATIFAAFFGTIMVLRATAERRPEIERARRVFARLGAAQQSGAFLVAAHLIGALLVVGAMAVLAPIQGANAPDRERRAAAESCLRGMCLAPLWSPFWIAMAVAYQHLPAVPLWQVLAIGLPLAAVGLTLSHLIYASGVGLDQLWRAVESLAPIVPPVAICAATVVAVTSFTPLSTLQSVALCTPVLCAGALLVRGRGMLGSALGGVYRGVAGIADEIVLVTVALVLGRVLEQALAASGVDDWIAALALPPIALIAITIAVMTVTAMAGIHQLVTMTVMLVLLAPLSSGLAEAVLMQSALVGWAFASMSGISAVSVAVAGSMFRVPMERLVFGPNLKFVVVYGVVATLALAAINAVAFAD